MYKASDFTKNTYRVHEVAEILGVTTKTVRTYGNEGKLKTCRTTGNQRIVLREDLIAFLKERQLLATVLDKCFMENIALLIAQAKKQQDLDNKCAIMDDNDMHEYINNIGRSELYDELEDVSGDNYVLVRHNNPHPYPRYLKAIRVSLVTQGYDEEWVNTKFKDALEKKYLNNK